MGIDIVHNIVVCDLNVSFNSFNIGMYVKYTCFVVLAGGFVPQVVVGGVFEGPSTGFGLVMPATKNN